MTDDLRTRAEASLARGLEQSAAGETADLGDFTQYVDDQDALRTRAREAAERPTIALAREISSWDQDSPGTNRIPHWAANLAAHLLDKGWAHAAQQPSREQVAEVLAVQWFAPSWEQATNGQQCQCLRVADRVLALPDGADR